MNQSDLISRSGLKKQLETMVDNCKTLKLWGGSISQSVADIAGKVLELCIRAADEAAAEDAVPVVHGRWEFEVTCEFGCRYHSFAVKAKCSECGMKRPAWYGAFPHLDDEEAELAALVNAAVQNHPKFCEECGAKMDNPEK